MPPRIWCPKFFNPRTPGPLTSLSFVTMPRAAPAEKTLITLMTNLLRFRPHLCPICSIHVAHWAEVTTVWWDFERGSVRGDKKQIHFFEELKISPNQSSKRLGNKYLDKIYGSNFSQDISSSEMSSLCHCRSAQIFNVTQPLLQQCHKSYSKI